MAKDKTKVDDFNFDDDLGFEDFDYGSSESNFSAESKKSKKDRGVIGEVFTGVLKGAKDEALQAQFIADGLKGALPEQYETLFATVDDVARESTALYDDAVNKIKPAAANAARKIDRLIPEESKFLKKLSNKFKELTGAGEEGTSGPSKEERDNQTIANELAQIFGAQQERQDEIDARDKSEQKVKDYIEDKRRGRELHLTSGMAKDIGALRTYQDQITTKYYQKSLEIQLRSYFLQSEALRSNQELFNVMQKQLEAIAKNTSLPEYAKITDWERLKNQGKERFISGFFDKESPIKRLFGKIRGDVNEYVEGVREGLTSIGDLAGEFAEMDQLQQEMAQYGFEADSKTKQFASMGGGILAQKLRDKVTGGIRERLKGTKLDAKGWEAYVKLKNLGGYGTDELEDRDSYVNTLKNQLGFKGAAGSAMEYVLKGMQAGGIDGELTKRPGVDTIHDAARFTNRFTRTVEEVIPSLLTEILSAVSGGKRMTFDFQKGRLVTTKERVDSLKKESFEKMKSSSSLFYSDKMLETLLDGEKVGSREGEIRDFINAYSMLPNRTFEQDSIKRSKEYFNLSPQAKRDLERIFTKWDGDEFKYKKIAALQDYSDKFNADFEDQRKTIDLLHQIGDTDQLVEAGLISVDEKGKQSINIKGLIESRVKAMSEMSGYRDHRRKVDGFTSQNLAEALNVDKSSSLKFRDEDLAVSAEKGGFEAPKFKDEDLAQPGSLDDHFFSTIGKFTSEDLATPVSSAPKPRKRRRGRFVDVPIRAKPEQPPEEPKSEVEAYLESQLRSGDPDSLIKKISPTFSRRVMYFNALRRVDEYLANLSPDQAVGKYAKMRSDAIERIRTDYADVRRRMSSDVNVKTDIDTPDSRNSKFHPGNILEKFRNMKIFNWRYKKDFGDPRKHLGPMAQDVKEQFGEKAAPGGTSIDAVTMNGINMMAIQELDRQMQERGEDATTKQLLNAIRMNTYATQAKLDSIGNLSISLGSIAHGMANTVSSAIGSGLGAGQELSKEALAKIQETYGMYKPTVAGSLKNLGGSIYDLGIAGYDKLLSGGKRGLAAARSMRVKGKRFLRNNIFTTANKERLSEMSRWVFDQTVDGVKNLFEFVKDTMTVKIPNAIQTVKNTVNGMLKGMADEINGPCDVYVRDDEEPVMTAKRMKRGLYRDSSTGERIFNRNDLLKSEGSIEDMRGEVVLTQEQIADGIFTKVKGEFVPIRKIASRLGHFAGGAAMLAGKWLKDRAVSAFRGSKDFGQNALERVKGFFGNVGSYFDEKLSKFSMGTGEYDERIFKVLVEMRGLMRGEDPDRFEDTLGKDKSDSSGKITVASGTKAVSTSTSSSQGGPSEDPVTGPADRPEDTNYKADPNALTGLGTMIGVGAKGVKGAITGALEGWRSNRGMRSKGKGALLQGFLGAKEAVMSTGDKPEGSASSEDGEKTGGKNLLTKLLKGLTTIKDSASSKISEVKEKGKRAFNDTDGDGLREGAWQKEIEKQNQKKIQRESREVAKAANDPRYTTGGFSLGSLMGSAGGFLSGASGLLASAAEFLGLGALAEKLRRRKDKKGLEKLKRQSAKINPKDSLKNVKKKGFFGRHKGKLALLSMLGLAMSDNVFAGESSSDEAKDKYESLANNEGSESPSSEESSGGIWNSIKENPIGSALDAVFYGSLAKGGYDWLKRKGAGLLGRKAVTTAASVASTAKNASLLGRAAALGGRALMWGGRALFGLSNPVGIAVTVGTAGYYGWKYLTRNKIDDFEKIRFIQYGFANGEEQEKLNGKLKALEDYLSKNRTQKRQDGTWQFNQAALDLGELMDILDLDPRNREQKQKFEDWFTNRFQPYFLAHWTVLKQILPKAKSLSDISNADNEARLSYLKKVTFENGPCDVIVSPFPEFPFANSNMSEVDVIIKKKIDEISGYQKPKNIGGNPMRQMMLRQKQEEEERERLSKEELDKLEDARREKSKLAEAQFDKNRNRNSSATSKENQNIQDWAKRQTEEGQAPSINASAVTQGDREASSSQMMPPGMASGGLLEGTNGLQYVAFNKPNIKIDGLNPAFRKQFLGMAQEYGELTGKKLLVTSGTRTSAEQARLHRENPRKAAPPGRSLHEFGLALDINSPDLDALDKMGLLKKYGFTRPVGGETWHMEPAGIQINISRSRKDASFAAQAIEAGIGRGGGGYGSVKKTPVGGRNPELAKKLLDLDAGRMIDYSKDKANMNLPEPVFDNTKMAANDSSMERSTSVASLGTSVVPAASSLSSGESLADPDREPKPQGVSIPSVEKTGGEFNVTPSGVSQFSGTLGQNYSDGDVKDIITKASRRAGMDPKMMMTFAAKESSLNPNAKAKTSSATGLFQFLKKTWAWITGQKGSKYGIKPTTPPTDPEASTLMAAEYLKQNMANLRGVVSSPGITEAYLTHFMGPGGAKKFLSSNPNAIAAQVMPQAAAANRAIFYEGGRPRTVAQVYNTVASQLEKTAKDFGIGLNVAKNMETVPGVSDSTDFFTKPATPNQALTAPAKESSPVSVVRNTSSGRSTADIDSALRPAVSNYTQAVQPEPSKPKIKEETQQSFDGVQETLNKSLKAQEQMLEVLKQIASSVDPKVLVEALTKMSSEASKPPRPTNNPGSQGQGTQLPTPSFDLRRSI